MNNKILLFYSPKPRSHVRILIYRKWPIVHITKSFSLLLQEWKIINPFSLRVLHRNRITGKFVSTFTQSGLEITVVGHWKTSRFS